MVLRPLLAPARWAGKNGSGHTVNPMSAVTSKFKATVEIARWKEHVCVGCGSTFRYLIKREQTAQGPSAGAAEDAARRAAADWIDKDVEIEPCPACGMYQPDMVAAGIATGHGCLSAFLALLLFVLAVLAGLTNI